MTELCSQDSRSRVARAILSVSPPRCCCRSAPRGWRPGRWSITSARSGPPAVSVGERVVLERW